MTSAPKKITPAGYSPSVRIRLLWWFGIYIAAQLPLVHASNPFWSFPAGIAFLFLGEFSYFGLIPLGYALYFVHLAISLLVRKKRTFQIMMVVLIIIASLNLWSCEALDHIGYTP